MRAGAEQGRWANASLDWLPQLLKERLRDRGTGMAGFLNSKPSWKTETKQYKVSSFLIMTVSGHAGEISLDTENLLMATKSILYFPKVYEKDKEKYKTKKTSPNTDLGHILFVAGPRLGWQQLAENPVAAGVVVLALQRWADTLELELQEGQDMRF